MGQSPIFRSFHALSDPIRIQIIEILREEELCVGDICERLGQAQSKVSFHLKTLKTAGLLLAEQRQRKVFYRLNPDTFSLLEAYLSGC